MTNRTPSRKEINLLTKSQKTAVSLAQREMGQAWQQLQGMEPAQQRDMLLELVPAIIDEYRERQLRPQQPTGTSKCGRNGSTTITSRYSPTLYMTDLSRHDSGEGKHAVQRQRAI